MNLKATIFAAALISVSVFSFDQKADSANSTNGVSVKYSSGTIDWANKVIKVKGAGVVPDTGGIAQKRLKARIAARMDAYRNIAEVTNGVHVTSQTTVSNFIAGSDVIKLSVDAVIKGARQLGEETFNEDGSVELEMYLPLFGSGSLAGALDLGNYIKKHTSLQSYVPYRVATLENFKKNTDDRFLISQANQGQSFTGVIIDAGFLGVEPAMSPFIVGGGKIIYAGGRVDIDPDKIVKQGVLDYTNNLEAAKSNIQRVGSNPLIIEAKGATGSPHKTNILLDDLTLNNLIEANQKSGFLKNLSVIVVI